MEEQIELPKGKPQVNEAEDQSILFRSPSAFGSSHREEQMGDRRNRGEVERIYDPEKTLQVFPGHVWGDIHVHRQSLYSVK